MLTSPVEALRQLFLFEERPNLRPRYNAAPTDELPIVRLTKQGRRELVIARWGLIPYWAKDKDIGYRTINARADSLVIKPAFREAYRKRRCLVLANGFYEWHTEGKIKQPYLIQLKSGQPFAFAGLWEFWVSTEGEEVRSFTIITTDPNAVVAPLHTRMPVVLDPAYYDAWLDPSKSPAGDPLAPCPDDWLQTIRVSTRVNSVKNDDPECVAPLSEASLSAGR